MERDSGNGEYNTKRVFEYIVCQHERVLRHVDALDMKIAQVVALNGVVLSFIFDKLPGANSEFLFGIGLILILLSIGFGVVAFVGRNFSDSPDPSSYGDTDTVVELRDLLIDDMKQNLEVQQTKVKWFNAMLIFNILGLTFVVLGYYG